MFAELVQCLDDTSLSLINRDPQDDGRKSLKILNGSETNRCDSKVEKRIALSFTSLKQVTSYFKNDISTVHTFKIKQKR